ncbi:glycosyltransferase family 2 protein [Candidatus Woesearchaeota archaeon]|jgi:glycosyltransferase involved in cell wall biosynthesis|nr:glycosyltransferase family 2 protein [Candidatus Woesearchaeota archaeon]MBT5739705.1 glycosyltransferase family 2 protein [Candidatus Woesearchaeota archaeon]
MKADINLVVMIPAFNEEKTIGKVVSSIPRDCAKTVKVLVVNDGSKDNTVIEAKKAGADKIYSHKTNLGLGTTFKDGINEALKMGADIIINIDADGQFDTNDIPKLLAPIIENKADMATCSRFKDKSLHPTMPGIKSFGNKLVAKILNKFLKKNYADTQCGFRAYSKEAALRLILFGKFTYTQEVFIDLIKKGFRIVEVPCKVKGQREGKSRIVKSWFDYGLKVSLILLRTMRDYEPLKFFGVSGFVLFSLGGLSSIALFIRWLVTNHVDPYLIVVYANIFLIIIGILLMILALIADMLDRNRMLQEDVLYRLKKQELKK